MAEKEPTNTELLTAITELHEAVSQGFAANERDHEEIKDSIKTAKAQIRELETRVDNLPDDIDQTYSRMLNDVLHRLEALEAKT